MTTVAVILAAGVGSRYDGATHKLLAPFRDRPLVAWAIEVAVESQIGPVLVVGGAVDLAAHLPPGVQLVENDRWAEGQATSLAAAVGAATETGADAIVVGLGDQPLLEPSAWRAVAASASLIAVATYEGRRRNPVRLAAEVWPLLDREGDEGARGLMRRRPELVEEVACVGNPVDVDTVEELNQWS
ncbi:MAG: nucleotidyltransferase family protein [Acidimicrobiales bacterium]